jgi:hypothetical protein
MQLLVLTLLNQVHQQFNAFGDAPANIEMPTIVPFLADLGSRKSRFGEVNSCPVCTPTGESVATSSTLAAI